MKAVVSNFGLQHSGSVMGPLAQHEPFEVIALEVGPCNCGHNRLGVSDPRGEHASYCESQYVVALVAGRLRRLYCKDIQIITEEEVTA